MQTLFKDHLINMLETQHLCDC